MSLPFDATLKDLGRDEPADFLATFDRPPNGAGEFRSCAAHDRPESHLGGIWAVVRGTLCQFGDGGAATRRPGNPVSAMELGRHG
jgi:hypothetical protein